MKNIKLAVFCSTAIALLAVGGHAQWASAASAAESKPIRGPWKPDLPVAKGYNDAARSLAMVDDNPMIRWAYRVWCETGYRHPGEEGTGQAVDKLPDPARDLVSPNGFFYNRLGKPMPAGGVRFLDNAWYFGDDFVGSIIVKTPAGLVMIDALTTPDDMQKLVIEQMPAAGLNPADIKYIFMGHQHFDHTGGANLIREKYAPGVQFVMGEPDAKAVATMRDAALKGTLPLRGIAPASPAEAEARRKAQIAAIPERMDLVVPEFPGMSVGMKRFQIGANTEVVATLNPGHTIGQMSVIIPVAHQGQIHKLLVWSGNDQPSQASQYAISASFVRAVAEQEGADAFINTHAYQSAAFYHLRQLKQDPKAPNPILMGRDGVSRYLGIFSECQRATQHRLADGTWQAW